MVGRRNVQDLDRTRKIQQEDTAGRRRKSGKTGIQGGQKAQGNDFELVDQPENDGDGQDIDHDGNHDRDQCNNSATGTCRAVRDQGSYLYGCDIVCRTVAWDVRWHMYARCEMVPLLPMLVSPR